MKSILDRNRRRQKGATSVVVIMMMTILIVFGLAALSTSASFKQLSEKVVEKTSQYYDLHGMALARYAEISELAYAKSNKELKNEFEKIEEKYEDVKIIIEEDKNDNFTAYIKYSLFKEEAKHDRIEVLLEITTNKNKEKGDKNYQIKKKKWLRSN